MSEIDPLVAQILLKGDDEFLEKLKHVGEQASESFEKLANGVKGGLLEGAGAAVAALGLITTAISGATAATINFIEQQTELSQATKLLADSFGTSGEQLQAIEQIFASSGVKVEQFERFAVRLSTTIAREWPHIAEQIKSFANDSDASHLRVENAIIRVRDAQNKLADNSAERSAQMAKDNDAVEAAYIKLQFAAQHAASEQLAALQAVNGAQLSVTAAEQHLAELEGRPPSAAEKQNLAIAQAQQAVDTARRAEADARIAQQEKAAGAALKARQIEQEYDDLSRKAAKNARDDAEQRVKDQNAVREAIIARGEAEQRAEKFAQSNAVSIRGALDGVISGNSATAKQINLTEVTVENLKRGVIALAAETSKAAVPTGFEALRTIAKLLKSDVEGLINPQQRLRLVTELAGTSMQALGRSAAEILDVIQEDGDAFDKLVDHTEALGGKIDEDAKKIKEFRGALSLFNLTISEISQAFAAAISPAFTAFLSGLTKSLTDSNGILHEFVSGIAGLGHILAEAGRLALAAFDGVAKLIDMLDPKRLHLDGWDLIKAILIGIAGVLVGLTGTFGAIAAGVVAIVLAVGTLRDHWDEITKAVEAAWEKVKDNAVFRFFERAIDLATKLKNLLSGMGFQNVPATSGPAHGSADNSSGQDDPQGVQSHAAGGYISGPGTGTSDSILSRLSNGEFVVKAAAVANYGVGLFHALNNMMLPGFASGGLVGAPVRLGGGGSVPATSTLNLSIDGRTFNGLRGPKSTIDDLSSFAIARQTSAAGNNPSWMK